MAGLKSLGETKTIILGISYVNKSTKNNLKKKRVKIETKQKKTVWFCVLIFKKNVNIYLPRDEAILPNSSRKS